MFLLGIGTLALMIIGWPAATACTASGRPVLLRQSGGVKKTPGEFFCQLD